MGGNTRLVIYPDPPSSPELKELGIAEVSPNKGESDEHYILRQIAERVPPDLSGWSSTGRATR